MTTTITSQMLSSNENDAFRTAFNVISRAALPFMSEDAYFSDLLHDAAWAASLAEGARMYLLVRKLGTNLFTYCDDAVEHCNPSVSDGQAVLRIKRHRFNRFTAEVMHAVA